MSRYPNLIAALLLCISAAAQPQETPQAVTLAVTNERQTEETLQLRCQIANNSGHDIWVCDSMSVGGLDFETVWAKGSQVFTIRRRTDMPWDVMRNPPLARYRRVAAGDKMVNMLLLPLPMCTQGVLSSGGTPPATGYVARIAVEIGYHEADLPGMIHAALEKRKMAEDTHDLRDATLRVLHFYETNEYYRTTDEEIVFYYDPGHPGI